MPVEDSSRRPRPWIRTHQVDGLRVVIAWRPIERWPDMDDYRFAGPMYEGIVFATPAAALSYDLGQAIPSREWRRFGSWNEALAWVHEGRVREPVWDRPIVEWSASPKRALADKVILFPRKKAIQILQTRHTDCASLMDGLFCPACRLYPDMQSTEAARWTEDGVERTG